MKKIREITRILFCVMLISSGFISCESEMDKHYEVPEWLKGSAWDVLEDRKNYSIFLEGAEKAGFKPWLEGRSVLTVMAPDDEAFATYFSEKGISGIQEMEIDELRKLIGFHLIYYSYNKEKLVNFSPIGDLATEEEKELTAGLYYKYRTRSSSAPTTVLDPATNSSVTVYHLDRFVPVFSHYFFSRREIDAKTNYEFFYPGSTWTGGNDGFNVSNSSVLEYALLADNGYVHTIDKVLEPLETIYDELKERPDYSTFIELYDKYSIYNYDATLTADYGKAIGVDSLYLHQHTNLPSIAMEWPTTSYQNITALSAGGYTVFAPNNTALNTFFNNYWRSGGYESLQEVDNQVMSLFISQFLSGDAIAFPEEIQKGLVTNSFGVILDFDPYSVKDKAICVNGSFYGMETMQIPPLFESIVAPAFQDKNYLAYMHALSGSGLLRSFASDAVQFTMLFPSNEQMTGSGYELRVYDTSSDLEMLTNEGEWVSASGSVRKGIVESHTSLRAGELATTGRAVYPLQSAFSYWFVKDGKITSNALFNQKLNPTYGGDPFVEFTEIINPNISINNGRAYSYGGDISFEPEDSDGLARALAVSNDKNNPYNTFVQLMKKGELISGTTIPFLLMANRFVAFIPTNEALEQALLSNKIPGIRNATINTDGSIQVAAADVNALVLAAYLRSYFLLSPDDYPYIGSTMKSSNNTASNLTMNYTDNGSSLSVSLEDGSAVSVVSQYDYFPFAFQDGCIQFIDGVLSCSQFDQWSW